MKLSNNISKFLFISYYLLLYSDSFFQIKTGTNQKSLRFQRLVPVKLHFYEKSNCINLFNNTINTF